MDRCKKCGELCITEIVWTKSGVAIYQNRCLKCGNVTYPTNVAGSWKITFKGEKNHA